MSGALDRLHYEKDPCVKYDIGRKLWIYLHRDRSQEEFGKQPCDPCSYECALHKKGFIATGKMWDSMCVYLWMADK